MSERNAGPIGIGLGVVLLGAVAAFGIALPKATGDDEADAAPSTTITLPDELPHGLVAQDTEGGEIAARYQSGQDAAVDEFEEIYPEPAAVRGYANADGSIQVTITTLGRAPGLFNPHGPPVDPEPLGYERWIYELRRVDDTVCDLFWQEPVQQGQPVDSGAAPASIQCQQEDGDRTDQLFGQGLTLDQAVDVLDAVAQDQ